MEPTKFESLDDAATFMGKSSLMLIKIRNPLSLGGKVEPKYSSLSGLRIDRRRNIYSSWININFSGRAFF